VPTEDSYARTRAQSRQILEDHFGRHDGKTKGVLIVGASLSDGPLIDALSESHERVAPARKTAQVRVALTDLPLTSEQLDRRFSSRFADSATKITTSDLRRTIALRGDHLGTTVLWPSSHAQSAQFLEEMRVDVSARKRFGRADAYTDADLKLWYSERLDQWSTEFMSSPTMTNQTFVYGRLKYYNEAIKVILRDQKDASLDPKHETLRLELWARVKPTSERRLTLIGNSTGPLRDRDALRHETFDTLNNSSILAFLEGRPLLKSNDDLGIDDASTRWKTFLTVPIFVHVEVEKDGEKIGGGRIPAGVVTLASTLSMVRPDKDGHKSVFAEMTNEQFEAIKSKWLIPCGKLLLSPSRAEEPPGGLSEDTTEVAPDSLES
jgi:hypothetical protein